MVKYIAFNLMLAFLLIVALNPIAGAADRTFSDTLSVRKHSGKFTLINMFNTGSMFYFTGVVSDDKPSFDTKLVYDNKGWGGLIFKSFELMEHNPGINYALIVLNKRFQIGKRLLISPQIGVQLNQIGNIAGAGSDYLTNLTIAYKFTRYFTISNDAVMQNLVLTNKANWTNRVKLSYQQASINVSASLWDRNRVFDNPGYLSGGFYAGYSGIKLSPTMNLILAASSISVFRADTPRKSGLMFSFGVAM